MEAINKTNNNSSKTAAIVGVVCGIVVLVFGIIVFTGMLYNGPIGNSAGETEYTSYSWYGGDAYTGIQQAAADASNNAYAVAENVVLSNSYLSSISELLSKLFGALIMSMGLITICLFAYKLSSFNKQEEVTKPEEVLSKNQLEENVDNSETDPLSQLSDVPEL